MIVVHILLMILKIIGIILLAILGLLLLLVLILLFVPIGYKIRATAGDEPKNSNDAESGSNSKEDVSEKSSISGKILDTIIANGRVSWLFGLIRVKVTYEKQIPKYNVYILWFNVLGSDKKPRKDKKVKKNKSIRHKESKFSKESKDSADSKDNDIINKENTSEATAKGGLTNGKEEIISEESEQVRLEEIGQDTGEKIEEVGHDNINNSVYSTASVKPMATNISVDKSAESEQSKCRKEDKNSSKEYLSSPKPEKRSFFQKIKDKISKIKSTFKSICDRIRKVKETINSIIEKKNEIMAFLRDRVHKEAFALLKKEGLKLLKRMKPSKFRVNVRFGFDDPCTTGQVLAGFSVVYPFVGDNISLYPNFEEVELKGNIFIKGRIYMITIVVFVVNLITKKFVRQTIKDGQKLTSELKK